MPFSTGLRLVMLSELILVNLHVNMHKHDLSVHSNQWINLAPVTAAIAASPQSTRP